MPETKSFDELLSDFLKLPLEEQIAIIDRYEDLSSSFSNDSETDLIRSSRTAPPLE